MPSPIHLTEQLEAEADALVPFVQSIFERYPVDGEVKVGTRADVVRIALGEGLAAMDRRRAELGVPRGGESG